MLKQTVVRGALLVTSAFAVGWWAHTPRPTVQAAEYGTPYFQFSNVAGEGTLSVYSASDHTIYVYGGVLAGFGKKQCTYSIKLGRAGEPVDRTNCPPGSLF